MRILQEAFRLLQASSVRDTNPVIGTSPCHSLPRPRTKLVDWGRPWSRSMTSHHTDAIYLNSYKEARGTRRNDESQSPARRVRERSLPLSRQAIPGSGAGSRLVSRLLNSRSALPSLWPLQGRPWSKYNKQVAGSDRRCRGITLEPHVG